MKIVYVMMTCLCPCSCATQTTRRRADVVTALYYQALLFDPCMATYILFQADPDCALPAFLAALDRLDELGRSSENVATTPPMHDYLRERYVVMFDRAARDLEKEPKAFRQIMLRGCSHRSEEVRNAVIWSLKLIVTESKTDAPLRREAEQILKEKGILSNKDPERDPAGDRLRASPEE